MNGYLTARNYLLHLTRQHLALDQGPTPRVQAKEAWLGTSSVTETVSVCWGSGVVGCTLDEGDPSDCIAAATRGLTPTPAEFERSYDPFKKGPRHGSSEQDRAL
jgi:hypothetical protein